MRKTFSWLRLEPETRQPSKQNMMEARLYDPLWTLGRQWGLGEFESDNGASIVSVEIDGSSKTLRFNGEDIKSKPLEALVEREPIINDEATLLRSMQIGNYLLEMLKENTPLNFPSDNVCNYLTDHYRLEVGEERVTSKETEIFLTLLSGRSVDGGLIYKDYLKSEESHLDKINIDPDKKEVFINVLNEWKTWCSKLYSEPESQKYLTDDSVVLKDGSVDAVAAAKYGKVANVTDSYVFDLQRDLVALGLTEIREPDGWFGANTEKAVKAFQANLRLAQTGTIDEGTRIFLIKELLENPGSSWKDNQLEYEFSVSDGKMNYSADEYYSGSLEWYSFDQKAVKGHRAQVSGPTPWETEGKLPSPLEFSGMPKLRFWELEDEGVNFSAVSGEPNEILRMVFNKYMNNYANDWFMIPIMLDVGTMNNIEKLKVINSFGEKVDINPEVNSGWFELSNETEGRDQSNRGLFLAPVLPQGLESKPIETVEFIKDEMANMAWAAETLIEGTAGIGVDRMSAEAMKNKAVTFESKPNSPMHRLASKVPDNWVPLLLKVEGNERQLLLAGNTSEGKLLKHVKKVNE